MITLIEFSDALIKWRKKAQEDCHEIHPKPFDGLDTEGLDIFDLQALERYYRSLGNLINTLENKQRKYRNGTLGKMITTLDK